MIVWVNVLFFGRILLQDNEKVLIYRIYSINRGPWSLVKFLDLESGRLFEEGAYSRLGAH